MERQRRLRKPHGPDTFSPSTCRLGVWEREPGGARTRRNAAPLSAAAGKQRCPHISLRSALLSESPAGRERTLRGSLPPSKRGENDQAGVRHRGPGRPAARPRGFSLRQTGFTGSRWQVCGEWNAHWPTSRGGLVLTPTTPSRRSQPSRATFRTGYTPVMGAPKDTRHQRGTCTVHHHPRTYLGGDRSPDLLPEGDAVREALQSSI